MLGKFKIIPTQKEDALLVLNNISPEISFELKSLSKNSILSLIEGNIKQSDESWSVWKDDVLICIFGIGSGSLLTSTGYPWLISTKEIKKYKKEFLIGTKVVINYWLNIYTSLENYIPNNFPSALRWLRWAGFTIYPTQPIGPTSIPLHRVVIGRKDK